jgi:hypothetical protein
MQDDLAHARPGFETLDGHAVLQYVPALLSALTPRPPPRSVSSEPH